MKETDFSRIIKSQGAVKDGHFELVSGKHSSKYVEKEIIFANPILCSIFAQEIAQRFSAYQVEAVIGAETGGAILSQLVAFHLGMGNNLNDVVFSFFARKNKDGRLYFKPAMLSGIRNRTLLIVEDVLTTGDTVRKLVDLVENAGGKVVGVAGIWNRGDLSAAKLGVFDFWALVDEKLDEWDPGDEECPLCIQGVLPLEKRL